MPAPKEILDLMRKPSVEDIALITESYNFAEKAHKNQKRISGEPYFNHLFETAKTLASLGMGAVTISAGLLHDAVEDVGIKPEKIEAEFGPEVRFIVEGVTKLGKLHYSGTARYTESLRKLFVAMSKDVRVLIVKLADRLHNMQNLQVLPKEKRDRIALETLQIYAPLAYRIGIRKINRELEDLAFPFVLPNEYTRVKQLLKKKNQENQENLAKFHKSVLRELGREGITKMETNYRLKGLYSLYRKLLRKNWDINEIHDLSALRIIVPTISDCYRVLGVIHSVWKPLPGKIKDYIALPKTNGYRGIHTTIFTGDGGIMEIQIRTDEMHKRTEYGMHLEYKEGALNAKLQSGSIAWVKKFIPSFVVRYKETSKDKSNNKNNVPLWIQKLGEYNEEQKNCQELVEELKGDFFCDRVFIFTPKGDVIDLPRDSSPIDFAYAIHSDVGNHASGAKVNGKLVALNTALKDGDIVEIVLKPKAHPTPKWLEIVKTTFARKHIRTYLEKENNKQI